MINSSHHLHPTLHRLQLLQFRIRKQAGIDDEADTHGNLQREASAAPFGNAYCELRMLPVFELIIGHEEGAAVNVADPDIVIIQHHFAFRETHGGGAVAAAAALVEHQRAVLLAELIDDLFCYGGDKYAFYHG